MADDINKLEVYQKFTLPNDETVTVYREMKWGHFITIVTNKDNETVAVTTSH